MERLDEEAQIKNSLLISFGLALVLQNLAQALWTADERSVTSTLVRGGTRHLPASPSLHPAGQCSSWRCLVAVLALHSFSSAPTSARRSGPRPRTGRPPPLAGIDVRRTYLDHVRRSARRWPGMAGTLVSIGYSIAPASALVWTLKALVVVVLAGLGSVFGAFAAGLLLGRGRAISVFVVRRGLPRGGRAGAVPAGAGAPAAGPVREVAVSAGDGRQRRPVERRGAVTRTAGAWLGVAGAGRRRAGAAALADAPDDLLNLLFLVFLYVVPRPELEHPGRLCRPGQPRPRGLLRHRRAGRPHAVARTGCRSRSPFVAGGLAAVLFAMIIGVPTFRLRGAYFAIGTLGVAEVLRITTANALPLVSALPTELVAHLRSGDALSAGARPGSRDDAWRRTACSARGSGWACWRSARTRRRRRRPASNVLRHKLLALALSSLFRRPGGRRLRLHQVSYYPELAFSPVWTFDAVLISYRRRARHADRARSSAPSSSCWSASSSR